MGPLLTSLGSKSRNDVTKDEQTLINVDTLLDSLSRCIRFLNPFGTGQIHKMEFRVTIGFLLHIRSTIIRHNARSSLLNNNRHDRMGSRRFSIHGSRTRDTPKRSPRQAHESILRIGNINSLDINHLWLLFICSITNTKLGRITRIILEQISNVLTVQFDKLDLDIIIKFFIFGRAIFIFLQSPKEGSERTWNNSRFTLIFFR
mmetsp:Transcript_7043/g.10620  ORF Transcript_7043/g.10620 Transcript_7043/m.10620 type:complete len:203 (-) Transcript_7043:673-1281(-)